MDGSDKSFFSADFSSEELAEILQRIDDKVTWRSEMEKQDVPQQTTAVLYPPPQLVVTDISAKIDENRSYNAPFFIANGWGFSAIVKRFLNLILKIYAQKQAYLNSQELSMLNALNQNTQQINNIAEYQLQIYQTLIVLREHVKILEKEQLAMKDELKRITPVLSKDSDSD